MRDQHVCGTAPWHLFYGWFDFGPKFSDALSADFVEDQCRQNFFRGERAWFRNSATKFFQKDAFARVVRADKNCHGAAGDFERLHRPGGACPKRERSNQGHGERCAFLKTRGATPRKARSFLLSTEPNACSF